MDKNNWLRIFVIILLVKVSVTLITLFQDYTTNVEGSFALCTGDCSSYLDPVEHLVDHGTYAPDYRMPGYGVLYLPLYILFSKAIALDAMVILQLIADIIASFFFVKGVWLLTQNKKATWAALLFYGIGCTITVYNKFIGTEPILASLLVLSFYFLIRNMRSERRTDLFLSSFFMVWAYFCRPIFFPVFLLFLCYVVFVFFKNKKAGIVWFLLPFLLIEGSWMLRNYLQKDKIFLLTETKYYPYYSKAELAGWDFCKSFDDLKSPYFFPAGDWANRRIELTDVQTVKFPAEIYTPDFNEDSLLALRHLAGALFSDTISATEREKYNATFVHTVNRYTASIKANHFFLVYVKAPMKRVVHHIFKSSGVQFLYMDTFDKLSWPEKLLKLFFILVFQLAKVGSLLFIISLFIKKSIPFFYLVGLCSMYGFLVHPVIIGTSDVRYFYSFYPLMALAGALFIVQAEKFKKQKHA